MIKTFAALLLAVAQGIDSDGDGLFVPIAASLSPHLRHYFFYVRF